MHADKLLSKTTNAKKLIFHVNLILWPIVKKRSDIEKKDNIMDMVSYGNFHAKKNHAPWYKVQGPEAKKEWNS